MDEKNIDLEPPVDLPPPTGYKAAETPFMPPDQEKVQNIALEQGRSSSTPIPAQNPATTSLAVDDVQTNVPMTAAAVASTIAMPQVAEDTDLIEKEWVAKAKQIVERTKDDPYIQNKEINKVKEEYIKKRYNKDLKLSDN